jgi:glucose-1-phosphate cytidylyltransferase
MTRDIFRYIDDGDELVEAPFRRLIQEQRLTAYEYDGFWMSMDTFKDRQRLEDIYARGSAPWQVWSSSPVKGNRERAFRVISA